ncbi:polysaccharide lyase family 7 protein [Pseudotamlana agarivorans]|uniref:polysaccharide lyase family 7 protein n=1 Tax=Pseudotamlana agarivorans TaxID=481183 RepID=UPI000A05E575|nr:polysaccharide lyase family 7 protein [Tamlana agarivorans]
MKLNLLKIMRLFTICMMFFAFNPVLTAQTIPADLMNNCSQWKITKPDGSEQKPLCQYPEQDYYFLNTAKDAIVFRVEINGSNGSTANSNYIRSELRERLPDGSLDVYWTTAGQHVIYVEQAITHLPTYKNHLVATQIHGNKDDGIDDAMVLRLEGQHLFLSFNGGKLRPDFTIKTNYQIGTKHEVIFEVIDGKHYCYYSEDGNLKASYDAGTASQYLVKDIANGTDYVMDLNYNQTYFKVGNYTQSNVSREEEYANKAGLTYDPNALNYGEVEVYNFSVIHDGVVDGGSEGGVDPPAPGTTPPAEDEITILDAIGVGTETGKNNVGSPYAFDDVVTADFYWAADASVGEASITFDLGCNRDLTEIGIHFLKADARTTKFDVAVSNDEGATYTNVITAQDSYATGYTVDDEQKFDLTGSNGRYVKIIGHGNSANSGWTSIAEVHIYGENGSCSTLSTGDVHANNNALSIYPNPASNVINIANAKDFETVEIYNLVGKLVSKQAIPGNSMDISNLKSGLYIFKFSGKNNTVNKRVIKK